jgi:hypothetical protein
MRTITDSTGVQWTVFEVKKHGGEKERWSYLPDEFGNGWLCFDSDASKRRLTPIPEQWRDFGDAELLRLLADAKPVNRSGASFENRPTAE